MENLFIGVDISKDTFDVCIINQDHQIIRKDLVFDNSSKGIKVFFSEIGLLKVEGHWVCMEDTGHYGALLISKLLAAGVPTSVVNPLEIKRSSGITRGKSDPIDAFRIASYAATFKHKLEEYILPSQELQKLKAMMSQRELMIKMSVQAKNNLKSQLVLQQSVNIRELLKISKKTIVDLESNIKKLDKAMQELLNSQENLKESYDKITKVIGVGPITAIKCIVETRNFTKFTSPRKFSCHCGVAPFSYQSGTSVKGRSKTSKLRDKALKSVLFNAAATAINHDPQLKIYYKRKVDEGKHKLSVINAVANKIILRIFAVAMRDEPFVKFMQ